MGKLFGHPTERKENNTMDVIEEGIMAQLKTDNTKYKNDIAKLEKQLAIEKNSIKIQAEITANLRSENAHVIKEAVQNKRWVEELREMNHEILTAIIEDEGSDDFWMYAKGEGDLLEDFKNFGWKELSKEIQADTMYNYLHDETNFL